MEKEGLEMADAFKVEPGLFYTKEHEWARLLPDGSVEVGIDDYAQAALHEVVYVELPKVGKEVAQGKAIGAVESVKAVSDVFSPVSGKVLDVNKALLDSPDKVNSEPYAAGWLMRVQPTNLQSDLARLMDAEKYKEYLATLKH